MSICNIYLERQKQIITKWVRFKEFTLVLKEKYKSAITLIKLDIFKYIIISEELNFFFQYLAMFKAFWLFCLILVLDLLTIQVLSIELLLILPSNTLGGTKLKLKLKLFPQSKNSIITLYRDNHCKELGVIFCFLSLLACVCMQYFKRALSFEVAFQSIR